MTFDLGATLLYRPGRSPTTGTQIGSSARWTQKFTAALVDDEELVSLAAANDLKVRGAIDNDGWVVLEIT